MAQHAEQASPRMGGDNGARVGGVFVALLTPFDAEGAVDLAAIEAHVERLIGQGVNGLVALGTTGEFPDLTDGERGQVVKAAVAAAGGRVPVVVGLGAVGTAMAREHAAEAERLGADAVLAPAPLFWKLDDELLFAHYRAVVEATALPVILYDIPGFAGTRLSAGLVRRVALELPSVVGIKLTVPDFGTVSEVLSAVKPVRADFSVTVGFEDLALSAMLAGADGVISGMANFCAPALRRVVEGVRSGDLGDAAAAHREVLHLFPVYFRSNPPILGLKILAHELGAPVRPVVRTPVQDEPEVLRRLELWVSLRREGMSTH